MPRKIHSCTDTHTCLLSMTLPPLAVTHLHSICQFRQKFKWESIKFGNRALQVHVCVCMWVYVRKGKKKKDFQRAKRKMKQDTRAGKLFEVNLSLWIHNRIGHGESASAVRWWICFSWEKQTSGFVLGPAVDIKLQQSVYTTDFWFPYKFLKRSCRSSQYWDSKKQRNRPTFLLKKTRLQDSRSQQKILVLWNCLVKGERRGKVKGRKQGESDRKNRKERTGHRHFWGQKNGRWKRKLWFSSCTVAELTGGEEEEKPESR